MVLHARHTTTLSKIKNMNIFRINLFLKKPFYNEISLQKKHISSYYIHFYINHFLPQLCLLVQCSSKHLLQLYVVKRLFDRLIFIFLFARSLRVVKVGMVVNVQSSNTL